MGTCVDGSWSSPATAWPQPEPHGEDVPDSNNNFSVGCLATHVCISSEYSWAAAGGAVLILLIGSLMYKHQRCTTCGLRRAIAGRNVKPGSELSASLVFEAQEGTELSVVQGRQSNPTSARTGTAHAGLNFDSSIFDEAL